MANEIGNTEVAVTIQALVSSIVQDELKQTAVIKPTVRDLSSQVGKGMGSIAFPRAGGFTAETKTENTALSKQVLTFTNDTLALDQHKGILVSVEDIASIQSNVGIVEEVVKRMAKEMVYAIDAHIFSKLILASAASPDHRIAYTNFATDNSLGKADILEARRLLNVQNIDMNDRYLLVNPASEKALLSIDDFVHVDKYGASASGLSNGELGKIYGFKVLMSNIPTNVQSVAYHSSAVVFAMQQEMNFKQQDDLDQIAVKYLMSGIYGAKELRAGIGQVLLGTAS